MNQKICDGKIFFGPEFIRLQKLAVMVGRKSSLRFAPKKCGDKLPIVFGSTMAARFYGSSIQRKLTHQMKFSGVISKTVVAYRFRIQANEKPAGSNVLATFRPNRREWLSCFMVGICLAL